MRDRECQLMTVGGDDATCRRIDAGIVDQDVDRIAAFAHPPCEGRDAGRIGEIERLGLQARRAAAVLLQLLDDALPPGKIDRKCPRLYSSPYRASRMPSPA